MVKTANVIAKVIAWLKSLLMVLTQLPAAAGYKCLEALRFLYKNRGTSPKVPRRESPIMPRKRNIRQAFGEMSKDAEKRWQAEQLSPADPKPFQRKQLWCHIFLNNRDPDFELVPLVIGQAGCHLRKIYQATSAKIRVRGRGSGFLESNAQEAPLPLMVAITSEDPDHFKMATQMVIARLGEVKGLFELFCKQQRDAQGYRMPRQQKLWRFGEMSKDAETVLYEFLSSFRAADL